MSRTILLTGGAGFIGSHVARHLLAHGHRVIVLDWEPGMRFEDRLSAAVAWYLANRSWWQEILARGHGSQRIGLGA